MNPKNKKQIGITVPSDFSEKGIECLKELSLLFSDICAALGDETKYKKITAKYPKAMKLLEVMP